jgi:acyl carrier protein
LVESLTTPKEHSGVMRQTPHPQDVEAVFMDTDQLIQVIVDNARTIFAQPALEYRPTLVFREILGFDSVLAIQFILAIEESFGIELNEQEVDHLDTMGDLFSLLQRKVAKAA